MIAFNLHDRVHDQTKKFLIYDEEKDDWDGTHWTVWLVAGSRRDVVQRQQMLYIMPLVWGVVLEKFLYLIIKLWLMFKSRHLVLWLLGTYGLRESR
jgi:hypothetical protein